MSLTSCRYPGACLLIVFALVQFVRADDLPRVHIDGTGDSRFLRFDGSPSSPAAMPQIDLVRYNIGAWTPDNAVSSLFRGEWTAAPADFFRLDLVFDGLVNPPGLSFPCNIFFFGDNPLLGFVEFDIDANVLTGGELLGPQFRYHGAAGRFGGPIANDRFAERVSLDTCPGNFDADASTGPYFPERSGEEFNLAFLWGSISSVDVGSNGNFTFEAGESWIVRGPFLNRAHGFDDFILVCCSNGLPTYNPQVELLYSHSIATDRTTVSLVYPLNHNGAAAIAGGTSETPDCCADNQSSILEGLDHVSISAQFATANDRADVNFPLIEEWEFQSAGDYLAPENWVVNAIFAGVFTDVDSLTPDLAWTDVTPNVLTHDYDGDGDIDLNDLMLFDDFLAGADGGGCDADGVTDGTYTIFDFGNGFDVHDANYDGLVNAADRPAEPSALFDVDADGDLDLADYAILQRCVVEMVGDPMPTVCGDVDANDDGNVTSPEIAPFGGYMAGPGVTLFNGGIPLPITLAVD